MFNKVKMEELLNCTKEMQSSLQTAQNEMAILEVEGSANNGIVRVRMNCGHNIKSVFIDPRAMNNKKELENMFAIAVNDAIRKIEEYTANKMMDNISAAMLNGFAGIAGAKNPN